jgi:hypothetical protein
MTLDGLKLGKVQGVVVRIVGHDWAVQVRRELGSNVPHDLKHCEPKSALVLIVFSIRGFAVRFATLAAYRQSLLSV